MSFLKSFFGAMAAAEISEKKRAAQERERAAKAEYNESQKVYRLEMSFFDYLEKINCVNASFSDYEEKRTVTGDSWEVSRIIDSLKAQLKEFVALGGEAVYIYDFEKMDLYIEIVKRLKEYGWLDKQEKYVKFADDTYWLDNDWENEQVKRSWLSELLTLSSNEIKQVTKKGNPDFIPCDPVNENVVLIQKAYFLPQSRDIGTELFQVSIAIKLTDEYIVFYDGDTHEEIHYKSNVSNSSVQVLCTEFTSNLTAVDLNGVYVIVNTSEVGQVQSFYKEHNTRVQNENRQAYEGIDTLSGVEFERVCKRLLESMGFTVETTKASGDGGIDLIGYNTQPLLSGKYIIQCKRYAGSVGEPIIRDLYGVVTSERANKGILITTGHFTKAAASFAENKPIELIDGKQLKELIVQYLGSEAIAISPAPPSAKPAVASSTEYCTTDAQKIVSVDSEPFVHNGAVTAVLGRNSINSQEFEKWECRFVQNPTDLKTRCKLAEILHNAILGRISDPKVTTIDFKNATQQLVNLINPIVEASQPGKSRKEDYRFYMSYVVSGECDIWSGNITDAIIKWDTVADSWGELSGEEIFCSCFRTNLLVSVVACLELMGYCEIADNYRDCWIERLNAENTELQQKGMLFTVFGNNDAIEKLGSAVLTPTVVSPYLDSTNESSTLMCEDGISFSTTTSFIEKNIRCIVIRNEDSTDATDILDIDELSAHISARSDDILAYFGKKYA